MRMGEQLGLLIVSPSLATHPLARLHVIYKVVWVRQQGVGLAIRGFNVLSMNLFNNKYMKRNFLHTFIIFSVLFSSLNTPPGTKVKLLGTVQVKNGFLILDDSKISVLGGEVDHMVERWELQRVRVDILMMAQQLCLGRKINIYGIHILVIVLEITGPHAGPPLVLLGLNLPHIFKRGFPFFILHPAESGQTQQE